MPNLNFALNKKAVICFLGQSSLVCENLFFASNPHENVRFRTGVNKIMKLFSKNELDVSPWFW